MKNIVVQLNNLFETTGMVKILEQSDEAILSEIIDSMEFIKMLVEIEREFDISIEDEDLNFEKFKVKSDIVNYITLKTKN